MLPELSDDDEGQLPAIDPGMRIGPSCQGIVVRVEERTARVKFGARFIL
jgi:hypothetical protein